MSSPVSRRSPENSTEMLIELNIKNIALIEGLRIELARGLNVLTGETGAGKSIVVDCVNLSLGNRGGRELVRTGEEKGQVRALFDITGNAAAEAYLTELGIEYDDGFVEISRELTNQGRSICRIGGNVVPMSTLKAFTGHLVDLHGQQEHQKLMDPTNHVMYLDSFGGEEIKLLKETMREKHKAYTSAKSALDKLLSDEATRSQKIDFLTMQVKEIKAAKLKNGEEEELTRKCKLFENAEKLSGSMRIAYERVYAGGKSMSAQESLKRASDALSGIADLDENYAALQERVSDAMYLVQDIGYELQSIYEDLSFDPAEADAAQERLEQIKKLKRKYGPEVSDVIAFGEKAQKELSDLTNADERREELTDEVKRAKTEMEKAAEALSEKRKQIASQLDGQIIKQLKDLGMARTRFETAFTKRTAITADGGEDVEFMISPNPGEPLRPLAAIASGGEISRFMLALKVILAQSDGIDTMIFDEIDTGISGRMAQVVGEKMALLAKEKQVICVSHLAQIAALGDTQFVVEKTVTGEHTGSHVRKLDESGRIEELTRLVGGAETDESGREHARSMLKSAWDRKNQLRNV